TAAGPGAARRPPPPFLPPFFFRPAVRRGDGKIALPSGEETTTGLEWGVPWRAPPGGFMRRFASLLVPVALAAGLAGCEPAAAPEGAPPPHVVPVSQPLQRDVTDHAEFTGRTAAAESVRVQARVWGHLEK